MTITKREKEGNKNVKERGEQKCKGLKNLNHFFIKLISNEVEIFFIKKKKIGRTLCTKLIELEI